MRLLLLLWLWLQCTSVIATAPDIESAKPLDGDVELSAYLASEKLDGIRATWMQGKLVTRGGKILTVPNWFTLHWPHQRLDGELFAGRGQFNLVANTVLDDVANDAQWRKIRFMVFDAPSSEPFRERYQHYLAQIDDCDSEYLEAIEQRQLSSQGELDAWLSDIIAKGGEGLMLHRADAPFSAGSREHLIKIKVKHDAEAVVVGYQEGKGKYQGMMGALIVQNSSGQRFKIGTGFSDAQRATPPPVGATITYTYQGLTKNGLPRFAAFERIRDLSTLAPKE
ncbi:DNA ligase [Pseudoalteromonas sp. SSDWG2]|uniref:DNA ligase n=1 Tax=Pseudoalteromonas sp. SSDWG2 TaxID=3139391 RepID=UPI003BAB9451